MLVLRWNLPSPFFFKHCAVVVTYSQYTWLCDCVSSFVLSRNTIAKTLYAIRLVQNNINRKIDLAILDLPPPHTDAFFMRYVAFRHDASMHKRGRSVTDRNNISNA